MSVSTTSPGRTAAAPARAGFRAGGRRRLPAFRLGLYAAAGLVSLFALLPLGFVLVAGAATGWTVAVNLLVRPRVGELLINTLLLVGGALPPTIAVAVALAWLTERTDLKGARLWSFAAAAPLAVPAFVQSYAWISVMPRMDGLTAAIFLSVIAYFPFLYLPVAAQLRRLDPALEEAAAALGLSPARVFLRVVLPQLRLAICGGALLVALHLLAEYGLYVMIRFDTFTTAIFDQFQSSFDGPSATMLAGVLILLCSLLVLGEARLRGTRRYARIGSGAPRAPRRAGLGLAQPLCLAFHALVAALSLGVPAYTLGRWLWLGGAGAWTDGGVAGAFATTCLLALAGGLLAVAAVFPLAWLSIRAPGRLVRLFELAHLYVGSLPGVVIALALVAITVRVALPLYQTMATLVLAYVLVFLPRALVALRPSLAQAPAQLEEAAQALGRTPGEALRQVTLRLAAPGAAAGAVLVGLGIATELTATLMLAPNGTETLATRFWTLTSEIDYVAAAPYAVLMVIASLPLTLLLIARAGMGSGR
ncbi:iron ABC transporter permease [Aureimonas endophytica]|uniref:Iron ABC transporter permease n=1 Tax=Aureimonas endophytica TaxID=2027858 RepID=A0A916ZHA0_9HYPH|nr:iron ABC transporter permease [Aureimonas endophytica]GGD97919.1 iron ABC transporter permease [Aureimonas endophytica]